MFQSIDANKLTSEDPKAEACLFLTLRPGTATCRKPLLGH